ncbi:MAG: SAM-dependent methyltransferase [Rhodospirillales bacterium 20-64-7]|nr:MAG: SAM-dependent methyltransferase [Rhodospirillales bacterium 20-64-7]
MVGTDEQRHSHWQNVYETKAEREVSWFQESPAPSIDLIRAAGVSTKAAIVDIGGGASRLVDALVQEGFKNVTVLDLSERALVHAQERLGPQRAAEVKWVAADVTAWEPVKGSYDVWHDRAAFHFLTDEPAQDAYISSLRKALKPGGLVVIATFDMNGPERCSGLPVVRYSSDSLADRLGPEFRALSAQHHLHQTPWGAAQSFQFSVFRWRTDAQR